MLGSRASGRLASSSSEPDIELPVLEERKALEKPPDESRPSSSASLPPQPHGAAAQAHLRASLREGSTDGFLPRCFRFFVRNWERFLLLIVLIVLVVLMSVKGISVFGDILRFFQRQNNWIGWLCFLGLYCINVALFLPGIVLVLGAGFVFGFPKGFLAVWLGGGVGQSLAFLLARYLVQDSVSVLVKGKWRKWEIIDKAIEQEGWKLLVLLRLSPIVPYNLLNITMAATKIHFWPFAIASFFGIIPECSLLCYMGSLATDITQVISGDAGPKGATTYILAGITLLLLIGSATWATLFVRRAMRRAEAQLRVEGDGDLEVGDLEDAGNDLQSTHGLDRHHLQEDYVAMCLADTDRALESPHSRATASSRQPSLLLRRAALVAIPGLGSPRMTKSLMGEALRSRIWESSKSRVSLRRGSSGDLDWQMQRLDSLENNLLSPTSNNRH